MIIEDYLKMRENLKLVFMLVDFRHKPTEDDVLMYNYLKYYNIPVTIIANKYDKISVNNREKTLKNITNILKLNEDDKIIYFSSVNKKGRDEVGKVIAEYLK